MEATLASGSSKAAEAVKAPFLQRIFALDLRSLAFMRILLGIILTYHFASLLPDTGALLSDAGVLPRSLVAASGENWWKILPSFWSGSSTVQSLLLAVGLATSVCLTLGVVTRTATLLAWLIVMSIQGRNPLIVHSGDMLLRIALFWCLFLPVAKRYALGSQRNTDNTMRAFFSLAGAALLLQVASVYWFSVAFKTGPEWRIEGSAVHYALNYDLLSTRWGKFFGSFPAVSELLTHLVYWIELLGPFLFFLPSARTKYVAIIGFILLHLGFAVCLRLGIFPWVCIACLVGLLPKRNLHRSEILFASSKKTEVLAACCMVFTFAWNCERAFENVLIPKALYSLGALVRLEQEWHMFSPSPPRYTGTFTFPVTLSDGSFVDAFSVITHSPLKVLPRDDSGATNDIRTLSHRWNKLIRVLWLKNDRKLFEGFARYLCRQVQRNEAEDKKPLRLKLIYLRRPIDAPYTNLTNSFATEDLRYEIDCRTLNDHGEQ